MKIIYGIDIAEQNDRYLAVAEKALYGMAQAARPGAFLVDIIPIRASIIQWKQYTGSETTSVVKYVPQWMPGAGFRRKAAEWKLATHEMRDSPFQAVKVARVCLHVTTTLRTRSLNVRQVSGHRFPFFRVRCTE
jgi:hypothetical protein